MGKREVRIVVVPKWITAALLVITSAAMVALVVALSGRAYAAPALSIRELVASVLLFMPWGFLAFMFLDRRTRPRSRTYLLALIGGTIFAVSLLPTRVMTTFDAVANVAGAIGGASLAHLRKSMRVRFDH